MMGAGIALVSAKAGIDVVLIDQNQEAADRGKAYTEAFADKGIARKKATPEQKEAMLSRIDATTDLEALKDVDLIIEAVFEDPKVKAEMTQKVEAVIPQDAIFASNTSTLPITELAKASSRAEQFIGIHFFSPVEKMLLVEIIKGKETGPRAVAKALDYVRQIRKTPIVVNDARFFYANRCIIPYINEGMRLAAEGTPLPMVDHAAKLLGFPVGPITLVDETSLDLGAKIAKATKAAMGNDYPDDAVDEIVFWMVDQGRYGRKSKSGFFNYDDAGKRLNYWEGFNDKYPTVDGADLDTAGIAHHAVDRRRQDEGSHQRQGADDDMGGIASEEVVDLVETLLQLGQRQLGALRQQLRRRRQRNALMRAGKQLQARQPFQIARGAVDRRLGYADAARRHRKIVRFGHSDQRAQLRRREQPVEIGKAAPLLAGARSRGLARARLQMIEGTLDAFEKLPADFGDEHAVAPPFEQRHRQILFQFRDRLGHRGLREMRTFRGQADAVAMRHFAENPQMPDVGKGLSHCFSISFIQSAYSKFL